ncbi:2-amino-4-hydroxy-6-hydroxymethyldihydropteridine diphosphokinase [Desulfolutivibrio sulfoxidireducens]|uniref:2-amino-4-hydroxy-6- hydroxymethyldihydropteridine diphosphokinase n=1 Tax=Desulfolutivibrio sulfoxidireducens TaxID=2773299 RepID=UPI00159D1DF2|nr:2-amino-4-hydroxy-6-hydroxymethyldihydropteridine diphosphokinase [Desulfolutivibrio sulfoxidireducens]QLA16221.1 2-amino-4-hydroxy-6-hydroxymethyldihydropteridine diphosphokinase [Desulfolutivibrio sulfoxidireducens]QLA19881.1 2-amino-4-hydroxy-6-hydroxymethyldihydropteridine diphosphokinase [Desulfolutivibrio sulfoxidireducens]
MKSLDATVAYVGLGANQGDARVALDAALSRIRGLPDLAVSAVSPGYATEPQDKADQPWFHNRVAALSVGPSWTPEDLMRALLDIERAMGRPPVEERERFGPRVIDLDLLIFGGEVRETSFLTLPHPRMRRRAFVLVPLRDVAPDMVFADGEGIEAALAKIPFKIEGNTIFQDF